MQAKGPDMSDSTLSRREFLRDSTLATAGLAAGLAAAANSSLFAADNPEIPKTRSYNPNMEYRRLGKTGLWISAVCLGGHWKRVDKVLPKAFDNPGWLSAGLDDPDFNKNRTDVVSRCLEVGINYIDACTTEEIQTYCKALKGRRDKVFLGCSWFQGEMRFDGFRTTKALLKTLDEGMKKNNLEVVDLWRITLHEQSGQHTPGEIEQMIKALETAKKQGKARFVGFSSHDRPHIKKLIETYSDIVDVVVTPYTAMSKELPKDSLFEAIRKYNIGVFGIKPFASGSLFAGDGTPGSATEPEDHKRARMAIRNILCNPAITAPIPGLATPAQVDNLVAALGERRQLDMAEALHLEQAMDHAFANLPPDYHWLRDWKYV
jgi:aryl-alcohol dehydrogenase-like predicted oxidoreductase